MDLFGDVIALRPPLRLGRHNQAGARQVDFELSLWTARRRVAITGLAECDLPATARLAECEVVSCERQQELCVETRFKVLSAWERNDNHSHHHTNSLCTSSVLMLIRSRAKCVRLPGLL